MSEPQVEMNGTSLEAKGMKVHDNIRKSLLKCLTIAQK